MPHDGNVEPFRPGETGIGAARLNEIVRPTNATKNEFNARERLPLTNPGYPIAAMIWVYAAEPGRGKYKGITLYSPISCDSTQDLPADLSTLYPTDANTGQPWGTPCIVEDEAEAGDMETSGHRITFGGAKHRLAGVFVGIDKNNGLPTYSVNFGRRSWKTQWNMADHRLEQASDWESPNPTWQEIVTFDPCGNDETIPADRVLHSSGETAEEMLQDVQEATLEKFLEDPT